MATKKRGEHRPGYYRDYVKRRRQEAKEGKRPWRDRKYASGGPGVSDHFQAQLEAQHHMCAICDVLLVGFETKRDHNHETGQFRAVLCNRCNVGLHYIEDEQFKKRAERYLALWEGQSL